MRTSRILVLLCILPIAVLSCSSPQERSRGSIIGNGMIRFQNPIYKYSFEYDPRLTLIEQSQEIVAVEDRNLASPRGLEISTGVFEVVKVSNLGLDDFRSYAEVKYPENKWRDLDGYGVPGLFHQFSEGLSQKADYLFFLGTNFMLQVSMNLGSSHEGAELIRRVIDSLVIDREAPVIHEMYFDPPTIQAGNVAKLKFRATDNFGAIFDRTLDQSVNVNSIKQCRNLLNRRSFGKPRIPSCGALRSLGNDWYEIEIPTPPRLEHGFYTLESLMIGDDAGNTSSVSFPDFVCKSFSGFVCDGSLTPEPIRFADLEILNDNSDVQGPYLRNARFEPATIEAGGSGKLVFEASDDDPMFSPKVRFLPFALLRLKIRPESGSAEEDRPNYVIQAFKFDSPRQRDDGTWEISFRSKAHMRPGQYDISFRVEDAAFNETSGQASVVVRNEGIIDREYPRLFEVQASKKEFKKGEKVTIFFRAADDLSGIDLSLLGGEPGCFSRLGLSLVLAPGNFRTVTFCVNEFRHLNGDWHAFDLKVGENIPSGAYQMQSFVIGDGVGNTASFNKDAEGNYVDQFRQLKTEAKIVSFRVVR